MIYLTVALGPMRCEDQTPRSAIKSVIYNGLNNFIDSPGGEKQATALNHGWLKGHHVALFQFKLRS